MSPRRAPHPTPQHTPQERDRLRTRHRPHRRSRGAPPRLVNKGRPLPPLTALPQARHQAPHWAPHRAPHPHLHQARTLARVRHSWPDNRESQGPHQTRPLPPDPRAPHRALRRQVPARARPPGQPGEGHPPRRPPTGPAQQRQRREATSQAGPLLLRLPGPHHRPPHQPPLRPPQPRAALQPQGPAHHPRPAPPRPQRMWRHPLRPQRRQDRPHQLQQKHPPGHRHQPPQRPRWVPRRVTRHPRGPPRPPGPLPRPGLQRPRPMFPCLQLARRRKERLTTRMKSRPWTLIDRCTGTTPRTPCPEQWSRKRSRQRLSRQLDLGSPRGAPPRRQPWDTRRLAPATPPCQTHQLHR